MKQLGRPTSDVLAVTMPCFGTTHRTRSNAEILCDELAVSFTEIDIANTVHSHFKDIGQDEACWTSPSRTDRPVCAPSN